MKYLIKSGNLYQIDNGRPSSKLACLKTPFYPVKKTILSPDGEVRLIADVQRAGNTGKSRDCIYTLMDPLNQVVLTGHPIFNEHHVEFNAPRINHIKLYMNHKIYELSMKNNLECNLVDQRNWSVAKLVHNEKSGGWLLEADPVFSPYILMGLFLFCRYLDKENEFIMA